MVIFENNGVIDPRSISTFGVSVKEGDNPIGFFGTGLKYAIAVLLRTGHEVAIYAGLEKVEFALSIENVRGQDFEFVTMNGQPIGFTTQLGKQWALWMAYREIACNCKDESGLIFKGSDTPTPEADKTKIIVLGTDFEAVYDRRQEYILEDAPSFSSGTMEIHNRPSNHFYYRGVRVHDTKPSLYTYNDLQTLELTEDRGIKHQFYIGYHASTACLKSDNRKYIRDCVLAEEETFEHDFDYDGHGTPSAEFVEVVGSLLKDKFSKINQTAYKVWCDATKYTLQPTQIELTKVQKMMVEKALNFCGSIGFPIRDAYPILFVESLGTNCLGLAQDETIFIAERVFHLGGTKQLASTLIEEYLHLRQGWKDMSRELQSFLFDKVVSLGEELNGEPL